MWTNIYILTTYKRVKVLHLSHPPKISVFWFLLQKNDGYTTITTTIDYEKVPSVCNMFREMVMTDGIHMLWITVSVITGITRASYIQKKSQMIDRHRDYVPLLLHFHGYIPFQSVCLCVCVCVCLSPHNSAIFQPIFKCDTWLNASLPRAGSCENY